MCPGRKLAKRMMLLTCAMLIAMFEIEVVEKDRNKPFASPRFGFGVRKPQGKVESRIRKRQAVS